MQAAKDPNRPELDDDGNRRPATVARRSALRTTIWTLAAVAAAGVIGVVSFRFDAAPGDAFKRLLSREAIKPDAGKPAQPQTRSAATPSIPAEREVTFPGNRREQGERPLTA